MIQKKNIFYIAMLGLLILATAAIIAAGVKLSGRQYAVKINGKSVMLGEYKIYLYEQKMMFEETGGKDIWETTFDGVPAEEVAKQNALDSLLFVKSAANEASKLGIELTADDLINVEKQTQELYNELSEKNLIDRINISHDEIYSIIKENNLQSKLYDVLTKDYELSEIDFEAYVQEYFEQNKKELTEIKIVYVFVPVGDTKRNPEQIIEDVYEEMQSGVDFEDIAAKYSEAEQTSPVIVDGQMFGSELLDEIYNLSEGQISDLLQTDDGYYIFKAVEVKAPAVYELKDDMRDSYIETKKQEIYAEQSDEWIKNTSANKNMAVWDAISVKDV